MREGVAAETRIDPVRALQTPEGVDVLLPVAGPVPRALAWLLDLVIRVAIVALVSVPLASMGAVGLGGLMLLLFAIEWLYPVVFELWKGATPGKRAFDLEVVHDDGTPIGLHASLLRNLLRAADFMPFGYAAGLLCALIDGQGRRLGDIAAGTIVVHKAPQRMEARIPDGPAVAPPAPLTLEEQRAVIDFAERSPGWSQERAVELARASGPLVAGHEDPVSHLAAVARWLLGRR